MKESGDRVRTDFNAIVGKYDGDLGGGAASPLQASDGVAGGVVFE